MAAYPGDWSLLQHTSEDPWPGEPSHVSSAQRYYQGLADDIRDQVSSLRRLAEDFRELKGEFAPALRESSNNLADFLERAEGRFDTVASELAVWEPELTHGQQRSRAMLREAEGYAATRVANQVPSTPVDPTDAVAVAADHARARRSTDAAQNLSDVANRFKALQDAVDQVAHDCASRIKSASHDSLKNHRFDGIRTWLHDHAALLKIIADVLTFIATAIVIAIVVFGTGGLALALLATAVALMIHTVLAAQGDGSWVDVAIDAFALLTLGTGKLLTTGVKGLLAAREGAAAYQATTSAARVALQESSGLTKVVVFLTRSNPLTRTMSGVRAGLTAFRTTWSAAYEGGLLARLVFGDKEAAGLAKAVAGAMDRLGQGTLLNTAAGMIQGVRATFLAGVAVDFTFKGLNDSDLALFHWDGLPAWVTWKEEHTVHALNAP